MKLLFIIRNIGYGGACKQIATTANAMIERNHDVSIYTYNGTTVGQELKSKIKHFHPKIETKNKIIEYILTPIRIRRIIKRVNPDIIISWRANAGCFTKIASIGLKTKTIFSERTDPYLETNWLLKIATKIADLSDGGIFQTSMAKDYYTKLAPKSIVIPNAIGNSILMPAILPIESRAKEIVFVGRFEIKQKRQDVMLKAFKIIHQSFPEYVLSFYGDGESMPLVKSIVNELDLDKYVIFHGSVKNIVNKIRNARLLIMTSDYEGIPNTLLEAMQAGTPIVTTDCSPGGARIVIDNEVNGYIVPPRDHNAIAEKAIILLKDPQLSMQFIINGRKKLTLFEPNKIFNQWEQYIKSIFYNKI